MDGGRGQHDGGRLTEGRRVPFVEAGDGEALWERLHPHLT